MDCKRMHQAFQSNLVSHFDVFTVTLTKYLHPWYLTFHQNLSSFFPSKFEAIFLTKQYIHKYSDEEKNASDMLVILGFPFGFQNFQHFKQCIFFKKNWQLKIN